MTGRSQYLKSEEKLAILCSLVTTSLLVIALQQLKENEDWNSGPVVLDEYEELPVPAAQPHMKPSANRMQRRERLPGVRASLATPVSVDSSGLSQTEENLTSSVPSATNSLPRHPAVAYESSVFREYKPDSVLDSIFSADSTTRHSLLRQHLWYSSAVYDTASTVRLVRLSRVLDQFDSQPVSLEESTRRTMRRSGHPYDPTRPQPLSPQIPLGGVLSRLLDYIF